MAIISENGMEVLRERYLLKHVEMKRMESPEEMFRRVANAVALAELNYGDEKQKLLWSDKFFNLMDKLLFLPNSPTLMNAGTPKQQLSACFVLPVEDNTEAIFSCLKTAALIQKSGGGTGFDFSKIRPKGDNVANGGKAAGPVAFMKIFDAMTENIRQSGKRRGANMGVLHINHPDIEEFVQCKNSEGILQNFNISVGVTDAFMHAIKHDSSWDLIHPNTGEKVKDLSARSLWQSIIRNAKNHGDPGLLFLDEINRWNPTPKIGIISCTNPCGEVPLLPYEACNLGSINLAKMVASSFKISAKIKWDLLEKTVSTAIRFLDNVIDVNTYVVPEVEKITKGNRKIGLGVMGWADMLIQLGIPYASEEASELAKKLMKFIKEHAWAASQTLATSRGVFPNWEKSTHFPDFPLRNATCTAIAPTGSISIIAGVSSSIEPLFALAYEQRNVLDKKSLRHINISLIESLKANDIYTQGLLNSINSKGKLEETNGLTKEAKELFKTALEINFSDHLKHQLAFQMYTDNAISKTINLSSSASKYDIDKAFKMAWLGKAKGITLYRDGSKRKQVLNSGLAFPSAERTNCKVCTG
ncbi:MAG: adenosylcobalamin-dependent ribonucleoside-diphosphate reductase [Bacteroidota bacterium]